MKLNLSKNKFILFNPTRNYDFEPQLSIDGSEIEMVEIIKLLGLLVRSDLSWSTNTNEMVRKAYRRLWIIKRLKKLGAKLGTLVDIYCKLMRSVLEYSVPVWNSGITNQQSSDI